jgi:hypothetical protein
MGKFGNILTQLRKEEQQVEKQLRGIRNAISSLEFGSGGGVPRTGRGKREKGRGKS